MEDETGNELLIATIPSAAVLEKLCQELALSQLSHDIYLAYADGCGCRFAGFLVSEFGNIDGVIAHCPVPADLAVGSGMWRREVRRQKAIAVRIANSSLVHRLPVDAIWLNNRGEDSREVPSWVFSLCCVPVTFSWDGQLMRPRPFCPKLFESMAMQPQAPRWIIERMNLDHVEGMPVPTSAMKESV